MKRSNRLARAAQTLGAVIAMAVIAGCGFGGPARAPATRPARDRPTPPPRPLPRPAVGSSPYSTLSRRDLLATTLERPDPMTDRG